MITRYAINEDIPRLIEISHIVTSEVHSYGYINEDVLTSSFNRMFDDIDHFCVVLCDNDLVVGGFIGRIGRTWLSDNLKAECVAMYILPEYRGKFGAVKMIREFIEWSTDFVGLDEIIIMNTSGINISPVSKRCGLSKVGEVYQKRIK